MTPLIEELWDETPDAILAVAPDNSLLYWNRSAEANFGYLRSEAVGQSLSDRIILDDRIEHERSIDVEPMLRNIVVYESLRCRKVASLVHVSVSTNALKEPDGRACWRYACIARPSEANDRCGQEALGASRPG